MTRIWRASLVIELALLVAGCSPPGGSSSSVHEEDPVAKSMLKEADEDSRRGDDQGALRRYMEAVRLDPGVEHINYIIRYGNDVTKIADNESPMRIRQIGLVARVQNEALRGYLQRHGDEWKAVVILANNLVFLGQPDEAEKMIASFAAAHPSHSRAPAWLAQEYLRRKRYEDSVAQIQKTAAIQTAEYEALDSAGNTAYDLWKAIPKKNRKLRLAAAKAGETALRRATKIVAPWTTMNTLAAVLSQRAAVEPDSETAAELRAESAGLFEEAKQRRLEDRLQSIEDETRRKR
jgi:tetratricopeptide (TPR) repeat protein